MENLESFEEEIWKPLICESMTLDNYFVSNLGNIKKNNKILKKYKQVYAQRGNFESVPITISKKTRTFRVHRLVAMTFKPVDLYPPVSLEIWNNTPEEIKKLVKELLIVDHIDGNPFNNNVNNLRWVTPRQNNFHVKQIELKNI